MSKYTLSAIVLWVFGICAAQAMDNAVFERVPADKYEDMLRDGGLAYEHKDYPRAFELTRRTACAGDKTSQELLGRMYLLGQGVARDDFTGYAWIKLAAEFKFAEFTALARKLEQAIAPEQRAQANARADALRKQYGIAATNVNCRGESPHGVYIIDAVVCKPASDGGAQVLLHRCIDTPDK
jgi:TPR repeat protein